MKTKEDYKIKSTRFKLDDCKLHKMSCFRVKEEWQMSRYIRSIPFRTYYIIELLVDDNSVDAKTLLTQWDITRSLTEHDKKCLFNLEIGKSNSERCMVKGYTILEDQNKIVFELHTDMFDIDYKDIQKWLKHYNCEFKQGWI